MSVSVKQANVPQNEPLTHTRREVDLSSVRLPVGEMKFKGLQESISHLQPEKKGKLTIIPPDGAPAEIQQQYEDRANTALALIQADPEIRKALAGANIVIEPVPDIKKFAKELRGKTDKDTPKEIVGHLDNIISGKITTDSALLVVQGPDGKPVNYIFVDQSAYTRGSVSVAAALGNEINHVKLVTEKKKFDTQREREIAGFEANLKTLAAVDEFLTKALKDEPNNDVFKKMKTDLVAAIKTEKEKLASWQTKP